MTSPMIDTLQHRFDRSVKAEQRLAITDNGNKCSGVYIALLLRRYKEYELKIKYSLACFNVFECTSARTRAR